MEGGDGRDVSWRLSYLVVPPSAFSYSRRGFVKIDGRLARKNRTKIEKDPAGSQTFQNRIERYSKSYFENSFVGQDTHKKYR